MSTRARSNNNLGSFFTNLTNNSKPSSNLVYNDTSGKTMNITNASKTANITNASKTANITNAFKTSNMSNIPKTANMGNASKTANMANATKTANMANATKTANMANVDNLPRANTVAKNTSPFSSIFGIGKSPETALPANASATLPANASAASLPPAPPSRFNMEISGSMILFVLFVIVAVLIIYRNHKEIKAGVSNIGQNIRKFFNKDAAAPIDASKIPSANVTEPPFSPQDDKILKASERHNHGAIDIIDKIIPYGNPEVFNISKNEFTYYDAEPLCKALGAELATYDQVKEAWGKGADWCNYGWVKGQAAVYPTQKETWDRVQSGPDGTQDSCGVPGMNGGYFDNPELKFGVNCYGVKPDQSEHDQEMLMMKGKIPLGVPALEVERKIHEFKKEAGDIGVMPFNTNKWSTV